MKFDIVERVFLNTGNKKQEVTKGKNVRTTFFFFFKFRVSHEVIEKTFFV